MELAHPHAAAEGKAWVGDNHNEHRRRRERGVASARTDRMLEVGWRFTYYVLEDKESK